MIAEKPLRRVNMLQIDDDLDAECMTRLFIDFQKPNAQQLYLPTPEQSIFL